jgi:glucose-1-phosphate adenylyltransferase
LISATRAEYVLIVAGDHVYSMDYSLALEEHIARRADVTVACVEAPLDAGEYETVIVDDEGRVRGAAGRRTGLMSADAVGGSARASMGVYIFNTAFLLDRLAEDAANPESAHALGSNILPRAISGSRVFAHSFRDPIDSSPGYWRDIGTVDSYWQAHMELVENSPKLNLFDNQWPLRTHEVSAGPTRIDGSIRLDAALLGRGCNIAGEISHSVLSTNCVVGARSRITNSVLLPNVRVGANCVLDRVVVDTGCEIPANTVLCSEAAEDFAHYVSPQGIVLVTRSGPAHASVSAVSRRVA